jgi:hypothetical protein
MIWYCTNDRRRYGTGNNSMSIDDNLALIVAHPSISNMAAKGEHSILQPIDFLAKCLFPSAKEHCEKAPKN